MNTRTCAIMIFTDGTTSRYGVFVGPATKRYFLAHKAAMVGMFEVKGEPDYRKMTARYATAEAPAVSWQS